MATEGDNAPALKREFGRVVSRPDRHGGRPYIKKKFGAVEVLCLLDMIRQGMPDEEILAHYSALPGGGLEVDDLHASRSYEARFLSAAANDNSPYVFMLDENASYLILHDVVRIFGKSSHVIAEGLQHASDEDDIWKHMVAHKYRAILTSDRDFTAISRRYRGTLIARHGNLKDCPDHAPAVVYARRHFSRPELYSVIEKNRDKILDYLAANDAAALSLDEHGAKKLFPDRKNSTYRPPASQP